MANDLGGRPEITDEEKRVMLSKLEPYLKSGLSMRKAVKEAQLNSATIYRLMERDEGFREQIDRFRQYLSVMLNTALVTRLHEIAQKQGASPPTPLTKDDVAFLQWFANNSNLSKEEYGERKDISLYDPEIEIQKVKGILEEQATKEIKED